MAAAEMRSSVAMVKCIGVLSAVVSIGISVFTAVWLDARMTADAQSQLRRVTVVLADQTLLSFESLDAMLRHSAKEIERQFPDWPHADPLSLHELLQEDKGGVPHAQALLAIRQDGLMLGNSRDYPPPEVHTQDRDYFQAQRDKRAGASLFIGAAVQNRINGNWMIPLSMRLDAKGQFGGVLMAAMDVQYFSRLYERMYVPVGGSVYVVRTDGSVLASYPEGVHVPPADDQISFAVPIPAYGITAGMSIARESLRAYWRPVIAAVFVGAVASSVLILVLILYVTLRLSEYARWDALRAKSQWQPSIIDGGKDA